MNAWPTWKQITGKTWEESTNLDPLNRLFIAEDHREQMHEEARESLARHMDRKLNTHRAAITFSGEVLGSTDDLGDTLVGEVREHAKTWDYSPVLSDYRDLSDYNKMVHEFRERTRL